MRRRTFLTIAALAPALTACSVTEQAESRRNGSWVAGQQRYVPGEFIVTATPGTTVTTVRNIYAAFGVEEIRDLGASIFLIRLSGDPELDAVMRAGNRSGKIRSVQRNFKYRTP